MACRDHSVGEDRIPSPEPNSRAQMALRDEKQDEAPNMSSMANGRNEEEGNRGYLLKQSFNLVTV
jgi:hypothetical protein